MREPSVKGMMILNSVVVVRRARDRGDVPEPRLAKLSARTLELLDERIQVARWYPMECFSELLELDWDLHGGRDPDYMRRAGAATAASMTSGNRYQQFDYLERAKRPETAAELVSQVKLTSTVTLSYFDFMEVEVRIDPDRPNVLQIVYIGTDGFPEALRYSTEGFMSQLNQLRGTRRTWTSERIGSTVVFSLEMKSGLDEPSSREGA